MEESPIITLDSERSPGINISQERSHDIILVQTSY